MSNGDELKTWPLVGVWTSEPNELAGQSFGFVWRILRHPSSGHLCGYVGVPKGHPAYAQDYDDLELETGVHGGLTFAADYAGGLDNQLDGLWWLGFDCAHAGDYCPGSAALVREGYLKRGLIAEWQEHERVLGLGANTDWGTKVEYRNIFWVKAECESLAKQLWSLGQ